MSLDPKLLDYAATQTQREYVSAWIELGSTRKAAKKFGVHHRTIERALDKVKARAAIHGVAPDFDLVNAVPPPFIVKGVSTFYKEDGSIGGQWVKSKLDTLQLEAQMREAVDALMEDVPRAKPAPAPKVVAENLLNLFTFTDCHVGMRSWKPETGADWDLHIAEACLIAAFKHLIRSCPKAAVALINQLGDFLHFDGLSPVTPTGGNLLDADGRIGKVVRIATRILRAIVDEALLTHEMVIVLLGEGNHDLASSVWLRHLFALLYENEPRVKVIDSEFPYYAHQHGKTMLAFHHGHLAKNDALPLIFAANFSQMWGATTKRYAHCGHKHHVDEKEHAGMKVIQHPTIAARDAYASRHGWFAEREMTAITYHSEYGQVARATVTPDMLAI